MGKRNAPKRKENHKMKKARKSKSARKGGSWTFTKSDCAGKTQGNRCSMEASWPAQPVECKNYPCFTPSTAVGTLCDSECDREALSQAALKGTILRGQTEPKRRFSLIFADSRLLLENKAVGKRRFSQKTADLRRTPPSRSSCSHMQVGVLNRLPDPSMQSFVKHWG